MDSLLALLALTGLVAAYRNDPWPDSEGEDLSESPEPAQIEDDDSWMPDAPYNWSLRTHKGRDRDEEEPDDSSKSSEPAQTEDDSSWMPDAPYNWQLWEDGGAEAEEEEPYDYPYGHVPLDYDMGELPSPRKIWNWFKEKLSRSPKPPASPAKRTQQQAAAIKAVKRLITEKDYAALGFNMDLDERSLEEATVVFLVPPEGFDLRVKSRSSSSEGPSPAKASYRNIGGRKMEMAQALEADLKLLASDDVSRPAVDAILERLPIDEDKPSLPSGIWKAIAGSEHGQRKLVYLARALQYLGSKARDLINFFPTEIRVTKKTLRDLCKLENVGDKVVSMCQRQ